MPQKEVRKKETAIVLENVIFTIGYAGFPNIDDLMQLLKEKGVDGIIDVRSVPFSKMFVAYNKDNLKAACRSYGLHYRHYKNEFGARRSDLSYYTDGCVDFERVANDPEFVAGINRMVDAAGKGYTLCLLCAEKDPIICHRSILIGRNLMNAGVNVRHIRPDHSEETQEELQIRLLNMFFPKRDQITFWDEPMTEDDFIREAYRIQNSKVGYRQS